tara:strand:+ start:362 stop:811 length:450 start_codon:yes stop_codon:yes gene_type:complete
MDPLTLAIASFETVKKGIAIGKDLNHMYKDLLKFCNGIDGVHESHMKKKASRFTSASEEALDTFLAKKQVDDMENALREMIMLHGNYNMWQQFQAIRVEVRKKRREAKLKAERERRQLIKAISVGTFTLLGVIIVGGLAFNIYHYYFAT